MELMAAAVANPAATVITISPVFPKADSAEMDKAISLKLIIDVAPPTMVAPNATTA